VTILSVVSAHAADVQPPSTSTGNAKPSSLTIAHPNEEGSHAKTIWGWNVDIGAFAPVTPAQIEAATAASRNTAIVAQPSAPAQQATQKKQQAADENSTTEVVWEWDPYYTDVGANIPLTSKPIMTIRSDNEAAIYSKLIQGSAIPRYMVLEASVYPLPILGTYLKKHNPGFYKDGEIGHSGFNLIESFTAGFQEPWAVSAFFGNVAKLERPGESRSGSNYGYTGYLISGGTKHIKDNVLISDKWYEMEWKIKGKLNYADEKLDWSFRFGGKFNANPYITDVVYLGIHRSNLDYRAPFLSELKNVSVDLKVAMAQHNAQIVRSELIFGKKYPVTEKGFSPTLDVGFVWDSPNEYTGPLRDRNHSTLTFLLRPSIEF
jgi:hypothetical protein